MILVTGATGHLGSHVITHLLKKVAPGQIIAMARNEEKAAKWIAKGVNVRIADYDDKASLLQAFTGVEKLLLVSGLDERVLEQHQNVVDAAEDAGVKHIYYTSGATNSMVTKSALGPLYDSYKPTEDYIKDSALTYTIFQAGLYLETIPFFIGETLPAYGLSFPSEKGKASFVKREELGEAIAKMLLSEGHSNKTYILTGKQTYSFQDIADLLTELSGMEISFNSPDNESFESKLREYGVAEPDIFFASLFGKIIKNDEYDISDPTLGQILGREPLTLKAYLKETYLPKK